MLNIISHQGNAFRKLQSSRNSSVGAKSRPEVAWAWEEIDGKGPTGMFSILIDMQVTWMGAFGKTHQTVCFKICALRCA